MTIKVTNPSPELIAVAEAAGVYAFGHAPEPEVRNCGSCGLWGKNFYRSVVAHSYDTTCAADAAMDLPASFIPARQTMTAEQGEGCMCWRPTEGAI